MRLTDPDLERRLVRRARAEIRSNPALQRDARRPGSTGVTYGWLWPLGLGLFAMASLYAHKKPVDVVVAAMALFATGAAFLRAQGFLLGLHESHDLGVLAHLPVSDDAIFSHAWKKALRGTTGVLVVSGLVYAGALDVAGLGGGAWAAGATLIVLQWLVAVAFTAALSHFCPRWPHRVIGATLEIAALVLFVFADSLGPALRSGVGWSLAVTPAGWIGYAFRDGVLGAQATALLAAAPALVAAALLPGVLTRLRRGYSVEELLFPEAPTAERILEAAVEREMVIRSEYDPELVESPELKPVMREDLRQSIPLIMEARALGGDFLRALPWTAPGPIERLFARSLSEREKVVAEFMLGGGARWTRSWKIAAAITLAALAVGLFFPRVPGLVGLAWIIVALMAVSVGAAGFRQVDSGGKSSPFHAPYPMGYAEISRVILKAKAVRLACALPLLVALALVAGWRMGIGPGTGLVLALKATLLLALLQPATLVFSFSGGTNDSEHMTAGRFFFVLIPGGLGALLLAAAGFAVFSSNLALAAPAALAFGSLSFGAWAGYGALYNRRRIDLLRSSAS